MSSMTVAWQHTWCLCTIRPKNKKMKNIWWVARLMAAHLWEGKNAGPSGHWNNKSVGWHLLPWRSIRWKIKFHVECKLCFLCAHFRLQQVHCPKLSVWASRLSIESLGQDLMYEQGDNIILKMLGVSQDMTILKDYIAYARAFIHPKLGEEASQSLIQAYVGTYVSIFRAYSRCTTQNLNKSEQFNTWPACRLSVVFSGWKTRVSILLHLKSTHCTQPTKDCCTFIYFEVGAECLQEAGCKVYTTYPWLNNYLYFEVVLIVDLTVYYVFSQRCAR